MYKKLHLVGGRNNLYCTLCKKGYPINYMKLHLVRSENRYWHLWKKKYPRNYMKLNWWVVNTFIDPSGRKSIQKIWWNEVPLLNHLVEKVSKKLYETRSSGCEVPLLNHSEERVTKKTWIYIWWDLNTFVDTYERKDIQEIIRKYIWSGYVLLLTPLHERVTKKLYETTSGGVKYLHWNYWKKR